MGSSIQFRIDSIENSEISAFVEACAKRGVELKWFGDDEPKAYTSRYDSWLYIEEMPVLHNTLIILQNTLDMRVPLTFDADDCDVIADIIADELRVASYRLTAVE